MECFCICKRRAIVFSGVCCKKLKSIFSVSDGEFREIVRHSHSRPNRHFSSRELLPHSAVYFLRGKISFAGGILPYVEWAKKKKYTAGHRQSRHWEDNRPTHTYGIRVALSMWNFPYFYLFGMKIVDGERTMSIYRNTVRPHARTQKYCTYNRTHRHRMWYAVHTYVRMCDDGVVVVC